MSGETKKFDLGEFNKSFVSTAKEQKRLRKIKEEEELARLNNEIPPMKTIKDQTVGEIIINTKNTWFDLVDNLLNSNYNINLFENNRLFYIGLTILFVAIIMFLFDNN